MRGRGAAERARLAVGAAGRLARRRASSAGRSGAPWSTGGGCRAGRSWRASRSASSIWPPGSPSCRCSRSRCPSPPAMGPLALGSFALLYSQLVLPTPSGAGAVELGFLGGAAGDLGSGEGWLLLAWRFYTNGIGVVLWAWSLAGLRIYGWPALRAASAAVERSPPASPSAPAPRPPRAARRPAPRPPCPAPPRASRRPPSSSPVRSRPDKTCPRRRACALAGTGPARSS